jgi:hypothetical protein
MMNFLQKKNRASFQSGRRSAGRVSPVFRRDHREKRRADAAHRLGNAAPGRLMPATAATAITQLGEFCEMTYGVPRLQARILISTYLPTRYERCG